MILVEWKGDDERPFRLSFTPHLTIVHVPIALQRTLVRQIASAFEPQLAPLMNTTSEVVDTTIPLNVLRAEDQEWLLEGIDLPESSRDSEDIDSNEDPGDDDPTNDEINLDVPHWAGDPLVAATARELAARDAFLKAEANRDRLLSEAKTVVAPAPASETAVQRMHRLLAERLVGLERALSRPIADSSETEALLEESSGTNRNEVREYWRARYNELRGLLDDEQQANGQRSAPPTWLVEQSRKELDLATRALETFATHDDSKATSHLGLEARRRYQEAAAVWAELETLPTSVDLEALRARIDAIVHEATTFTGRPATNPVEALGMIREYAEALPETLPGSGPSVEVIDRLRRAMRAQGFYVAADADVLDAARAWVRNRRADQSERRRQQAEAAELRTELERLAAFVPGTPGSGRGLALADAEARVEAARQTYVAAEAEGKALRQRALTATTERDAAVVLLADRLIEATNALTAAVGSAVPLLIDAAFDAMASTSRDVMLLALERAARQHQILYFTPRADVAGWGSGHPGVNRQVAASR